MIDLDSVAKEAAKRKVKQLTQLKKAAQAEKTATKEPPQKKQKTTDEVELIQINTNEGVGNPHEEESEVWNEGKTEEDEEFEQDEERGKEEVDEEEGGDEE